MAVEIYPLFFGGRAEKEALDPVAKAMFAKNEGGKEYVRVCRSIQENTVQIGRVWVQNVSCFGSRGAEADNHI